MITETAAAIVDKLELTHAVLEVRSFPDDPRKYKLLNQHGAILVSYNGREWTPPTAPVPRVVTEIRFELAFLKKNLSQSGPEEGIQDLMDTVAGELAGFEAEGFVFFPTRDDFVMYREADSAWYYGMRLTGYNKALMDQLPIR